MYTGEYFTIYLPVLHLQIFKANVLIIHIFQLELCRTEVSERSRLHIGSGIRLELVGEGDLYLECLSNYSVFVQSFYLDAINNRKPGSTVHKFSSGANTKVTG